MGNILLLPCVCYDADDEAATTAGAAKRSGKKMKAACRAAATARHVVPVDTPGESGDGEEEMKAAWPGCRLEPVVIGDDGGGVRVKIVMKRKEAEELVARLEQRGAAGRKARMVELNNELGGGGAVTMMSPCRDAWRPRLAIIPEN